MRLRDQCPAVGVDVRVSLPASVVLTLWLVPGFNPGMIAAEGLASRPSRSRSAITSAWLIRSNTPPSRQAANQR